MKYIKSLVFALFLLPVAAFGAQSDFMVAAQLLSAARNADIAQVQALVNNGADINFIDSTGLSIVCTALMNDDMRAAQILQMYGADASQCDRQIKKYKSKTRQEKTGGLFSGLSSAQSLTLTAAGAAVVVGGLLLFTDVFNPGNGNDSHSGGDGNRPGGDNGGGSDNSGATAAFELPYGPALPNAESEEKNYVNNLNLYSEKVDVENPSQYYKNFTAMNLLGAGQDGQGGQNYLLMMHGYSGFARGYFGMTTLRNLLTREPISLAGNNIGTEPVMGGRPVSVALITKNGVNATDDSSLGDRLLPWTTLNANGTAANGASNDMISSKYYNNKIVYGGNVNSIEDDTTVEDSRFITDFDLSGHGTAIHNAQAGGMDNLLAKIVGGKDTGYSVADAVGFMPNGQMGVFRTGGGGAMLNVAADSLDGSYVLSGTTINTLSTIKLFGRDMTVVVNGDNFTATDADGNSYDGTLAVQDNDVWELTIQNMPGGAQQNTYVMSAGKLAPINEYTMVDDKLATITLAGRTYTVTMNGQNFVAQNGDDKYDGYIGADGLLYIANTPGGAVATAYAMVEEDKKLTLNKQLNETADYYNYKALLKAGVLSSLAAGDLEGGRSRFDIVANSDVIAPLRGSAVETIGSILAQSGRDARQAAFIALVNKYYNRNTDADGGAGTDGLPGSDARLFFDALGSSFTPLVLFSTGASETDKNYSGEAKIATFENVAPLAFQNLEHLFMSVVAVGLIGKGTSGTENIAGFTPSTRYALAQWPDNGGTPNDTSDDKYYKARTCGIAGRGAEGIDPWCFAAAGITDEMAVSSAAGAAGLVKSAFSYLNNKQLFALLALTADGPFLGTDSAGVAFTKDGLRSYLQNMYVLPGEYNVRWESGSEDYLDVFKEVFGYGLINVERATTPTTKIYYYDGDKIVSATGNAYWRAASATTFRPSAALNLRAASISAPFFDVLESADGTLRLPRVWKNEFSLAGAGKRGLYMGDVLGDLRTRAAADNSVQIGATRFSMSLSQRAYNDNMSGLDNMSLSFAHGNWNFGARYQHYLTDGLSKFSGMPNPILSLASNAVSSDVTYRHNKWTFGARAFSGAITDEGLLENDPTVSAQFAPARLGLMRGGEMSAGVSGAHAGLDFAFGYAGETDTLLGAMSDGLLGLGNGRTIYTDVLARYNLADKVRVSGRATFARTMADATGGVVLGLSDIESNAFAVALDAGNLSLMASMPLAVNHGRMQYAHAEYDVVDADDGNFDLVVRDAGRESLDLRPASREVRFAATYRHSFGEFTDGALGMIYRVHPNNTDEFGNESIFMIKMSHRLGI